MQKYFNTVTNRAGTAQSSAFVTVKTLAGTTPTLYSDNGSTPMASNVIPTDDNGYFEFYAADGRYTLTITGSNFSTITISDILLEDAADGSTPLTEEINARIAADAAAAAALAASTGAALVGFAPSGTIAAGTVQAALEELGSEKAAASDLSAATGAAMVGNAPAGGIAATTVQAAIDELDSEKASLAALAASSGASLVGYQPAGTVEAALNDRIPSIANYAALDAYAGSVEAFYVTGRENMFDGAHGYFRRDPTDTTSTASGICRVAANGWRYKREGVERIDTRWEGAKLDGATDDRAATVAALVTAGTTYPVVIGSGTSYISSRITLLDQQEIVGLGWNSIVSGNAFLTASYNKISGLKFIGAGAKSIQSTTLGAPEGTVIEGCYFLGVAIGVDLQATAGNSGALAYVVRGNRFYGVTTAAVFSVRCFYCTLTENQSYAADATAANFLFFGGAHNTITNNTTRAGITGIAFVYQRSTAGAAGVVCHNVVSGNNIYSPSEEGISFDCRGNVAADIAILDSGTVASRTYGGATLNITLTEAGFASSGTRFVNYFICFITGKLAGRAFRIGTHSNAVVSIGQTYFGIENDVTAGDQVVIGAASVANQVYGNTVRDAGTAGIILWGFAFNNTISNNTLRGPGVLNTTLTAASQYAGGIEIASINDVVTSTQSVTLAPGKGPTMGNVISGNVVYGANIRCGLKRYGASPDFTSVNNRVLNNTVLSGMILSDAHDVTYQNNIANIHGSDANANGPLAALTAANATAINSTYDATEEGVINNIRTRLNEIETRLQSLNLVI